MADRTHRSLSNISISEVRRRIASLRTADLEHLTDEAAAYRIGHVIDQYPFQLRTLQLTGIYRARSNKPGEVFTSASQLWYPPANAITRPSRLNGIAQVRFYASSMPNTATLELRPKSDGVFTILIAATRSGSLATLDVAFVGVERSLAPEVQHFSKRDLFRHNPDFRHALGHANYKKWLLIDGYLSEAFGTAVPESEEYKYKPTIALANVLFTAPGLDAINYPSVASDDHGINVCMLPDKADQLFVPKEAWMIRLGERAAHPETGALAWRTDFLQRSKEIGPGGTIKWWAPGEGINQAEVMRFARSRVETLTQWPVAVSQ